MKKVLLFCLAVGVSFSLNAQSSFTDATSTLLQSNNWQSSHPIAICDIDGDDKDDLVILDDGEDLYINFQNGTGQQYTTYTHSSNWNDGAWGMCAADADNDGYADILYGGYNDLVVATTNTVQTSYSLSNLGTSFFVQGVSFADIDNDGNLDVYACNDDGPSGVLLGNGAGTFTNNTTIIPTALQGGGEPDAGNYGCVWTDIDNDGDIDLYIAKCRQGVSNPSDPRRINMLYINNGNQTYTENASAFNIDSGEQSWSADFGDVDNDGDMDLIMGQHTGQYLELYINNNGVFADSTQSAGLWNSFPQHPIQTKFVDFDNDGYLDILCTGTNEFLFAWNNGDGTFSTQNQPNIGCEINSFALGDLNTDGFMDMYATPHGYGSWFAQTEDSIYLNDGNSNNWAVFTLNGVISNPDAIGTRMEIYGPWGVQIREVRSGESYGIQNTLNCHFGLGTATNIDSITITWPSGTIDKYQNVGTGHHVYYEGGVIGVPEAPEQGISSQVYPNPAGEQAMIRIKGDLPAGDLELGIFDISGKQVRNITVPGQNHIVVDRGGLSSGTYFYQLRSAGENLTTGKLIFN